MPPAPPQTGFWAVLHEVRSEYAQLLTVTFLLIVGPGAWSVDALRARRSGQQLPRREKSRRSLREFADELPRFAREQSR